MWRLPWWASGWEASYQCKGHKFDPWSGKIPRSSGQQAHVPRPPQWEAHTLQLESSPHWSQPEKAHMQQQRRGQPKINNNNEIHDNYLLGYISPPLTCDAYRSGKIFWISEFFEFLLYYPVKNWLLLIVSFDLTIVFININHPFYKTANEVCWVQIEVSDFDMFSTKLWSMLMQKLNVLHFFIYLKLYCNF